MSLPRMSLHIGDYKKDTGHLRAAGHGAYLLLIMHYWSTGGLPEDDRQLAAIASMTDREWKQWRPILRPFFGPGWTHKRIEAELVGAKEAYERRASAGRKGGRPPREKQCESNAFPLFKQPRTLTEKEGGGGEARARDCSISDEAFAIANEVFAVFGFDPMFIPPGWAGAAMRIQAGLNTGWQREIVLMAARKVVASITPDTFAYLEKPIAREHAAMAKPLPQAVIDPTPEVVHVQAAQHRPGGAYGARKDAFAATHDKLKAFIARAESGDREGDGQVVELVPGLRREQS